MNLFYLCNQEPVTNFDRSNQLKHFTVLPVLRLMCLIQVSLKILWRNCRERVDM